MCDHIRCNPSSAASFAVRRLSMKKLINLNTLIILCWIEAGLIMVRSLLQYFVLETYLERIAVIDFALILAVACIYYFSEHPRLRISADIILLLFMFVYLLLSCIGMGLSTGINWFEENSSEMSDMEVLIIIYLLGKYTARTNVSKGLQIAFHIFMSAWTFVIFYILVTILRNDYIVPPCGGYIGMLNGINLQINCHRNFTGALSMTMLLICLIVILSSSQKAIKVIYSLYAVIHYIILILSNSRTALISAIGGFSLIAGIFIYLNYSNSSVPKKILVSVFSGILAGAVFFLLRYPVYSIYSAIANNFNGVEMTAREVLSPDAVSFNGRIPIWKHSIDIIFTPRWMLTGVTPAGVAQALIDSFNGYLTYPHCHNVILQVGTALGIPGLCAFLAWLVIIAIRCLKILTDKVPRPVFMFVTGLILAIMLDNMAERYSIFYMFFISYPFFFSCGYVMGYQGKN